MADSTVTIVGGGVQGVHLAIRLLEAGLVPRSALQIIEPDGILGGFRRKCRQCGMTELRSPFVHHVDSDPFSLRDFARSCGRETELVSSSVGADRPTVSLFFDHAEACCERYDLENLVIDAAATDIGDAGDHVEIETTAGVYTARWCLLAVGHGRSYTMPTWARDRPEAPVTHVWDQEYDPAALEEVASVGVVGGGITAAQVATSLVRPGRDVTLFARSPFTVESLEADTDWMHFSGALADLHDLPPASSARAQLVRRARYDGAMPPHVFRRLRRALDEGAVTLERTEITALTATGGPVVVSCQNGRALCLDHVICATGFDSPYDGPLFRALREGTTLQTGHRGAPVLEDETLRWRRADGSLSQLIVTGAPAQQVLGPFARNVIGARRAGTLICDLLEEAENASEPSSVRV
ncbi:NAD(P)-binding domain-containing protein [Natronolimnobius sp. AArcel1]|uniref:FAD/NAD(P)-binding protein n=1 Tax=Natronolimnobius sp. AArcel1 TaxID=1679093 RepID=UPI0013EA0395|nr:FAD/NAD(P)-binding protein [Natronolimnobius sp. AArcel1]NGM68121.1 NAD(P)-binding domain-containing protein [Natronolimnobius sp. AArcel1]